jgi:hypothetical protein
MHAKKINLRQLFEKITTMCLEGKAKRTNGSVQVIINWCDGELTRCEVTNKDFALVST